MSKNQKTNVIAINDGFSGLSAANKPAERGFSGVVSSNSNNNSNNSNQSTTKKGK